MAFTELAQHLMLAAALSLEFRTRACVSKAIIWRRVPTSCLLLFQAPNSLARPRPVLIRLYLTYFDPPLCFGNKQHEIADRNIILNALAYSYACQQLVDWLIDRYLIIRMASLLYTARIVSFEVFVSLWNV